MNSMFQRRRTMTNGRTDTAANGTGGRNGNASQSGGSGSGNSTATTTLSSSDYARRCRELMLLNKDLRELGLVHESIFRHT